MKKRFIITTLLVCFLLCACAKEDTQTPAGTPPYYYSNNFDSYEELAGFIIPEEAKVRLSNDPRFPDKYKTALSKMITDGIPIPCKGEKPVQLYYTFDGNSRINLHPHDMFSAPRIMYYTSSSNEQIWLAVSLERDISITFSDKDSGSDIVRALAPTAANLHNAQERTDDYSYIGERIITTSNGEKNTLYKMGTENREHYTFMQSGYVVEIFAKPDVLTDEWFEDFSIELMPVSNTTTTE